MMGAELRFAYSPFRSIEEVDSAVVGLLHAVECDLCHRTDAVNMVLSTCLPWNFPGNGIVRTIVNVASESGIYTFVRESTSILLQIQVSRN